MRVFSTVSEAPSDDLDSPSQFVNYYRCPNDGTGWSDIWTATCNDRCPACGREIEPYTSKDLDPDSD